MPEIMEMPWGQQFYAHQGRPVLGVTQLELTERLRVLADLRARVREGRHRSDDLNLASILSQGAPTERERALAGEAEAYLRGGIRRALLEPSIQRMPSAAARDVRRMALGGPEMGEAPEDVAAGLPGRGVDPLLAQ